MMLLTDKRHEYKQAIELIEPYKMTLPFGAPLPFLTKWKMEVITKVPIKNTNWINKTSGKLHAKIMIGKKGVIIGSHNFTQQATDSNHECSIVITQTEIMKQVEDYFDRLWNRARPTRY